MREIVAYTFLNVCEKNSPVVCQAIKTMHTKENWLLLSASWCCIVWWGFGPVFNLMTFDDHRLVCLCVCRLHFKSRSFWTVTWHSVSYTIRLVSLFSSVALQLSHCSAVLCVIVLFVVSPTARILFGFNYSIIVLWSCWLGGRKGIRPVKNWVVGCWRGCLSGARCRLAYGPADATTTHCLLLQ